MSVRVIEPVFEPAPPLPPAIRKGPGGRREQLLDGRWVPMEEPPTKREPTDRQRQIWEAVQRHAGDQFAAARELGISQGGVSSGIGGYMRAMGITERPKRLPPSSRLDKSGHHRGRAFDGFGKREPDTTTPADTPAKERIDPDAVIDRHELEHAVGLESRSTPAPGEVSMSLTAAEPITVAPPPLPEMPPLPELPEQQLEVGPDLFAVGFAAGVLAVMAGTTDKSALASAAGKALTLLERGSDG